MVQEKYIKFNLKELVKLEFPSYFRSLSNGIRWDKWKSDRWLTRGKAAKMLEPYLKPSRNSMFERVIPVSPDQAENLLKSNYLQLSSFGRWDPVSLKDGNVFRPLDQNKGSIFPVAYGPYVYFCYSQNNRNKVSFKVLWTSIATKLTLFSSLWKRH